MDTARFKHKTQVRVRNYEVDWQGVVHNAVYLYYFEVGRIDYLERLGIQIDLHTIQHESKVVVARNEIDYRSSARFGELIDVYTRVASIRNTSFVFESILEEAASKRRIAENVSVHVWLDHQTNAPVRVGDEFRALVQRFEGNSVVIEKSTWFV